MKTTLAVLAAVASASAAAAQTPQDALPTPPPAAPVATAAPPAAALVAADPENTLLIETTKGRMVVEMRPDLAPAHVAQVKALTRKDFYDNSLFYRVIRNFVAQTGDQGSRTFRSDLPNLKAEFTFEARPAAYHKVASFSPWAGRPGGETGFVGSIPVILELPPGAPPRGYALLCPGAASSPPAHDPNSANSQIYFVRAGAHGLDAKYSIFGRVVSGQEVVLAVADGEPPPNPDRMTRVRVLADIPAAQRPQVMVVDPRSAAFAAEVARMIQVQGRGFNICDVPVAATVR